MILCLEMKKKYLDLSYSQRDRYQNIEPLLSNLLHLAHLNAPPGPEQKIRGQYFFLDQIKTSALKSAPPGPSECSPWPVTGRTVIPKVDFQ
jgi:hypothetical protein